MKDENLFDESDFQKIRAKSAHGGTRSELQIPKGCFSCDGSSWVAYGCLRANCPVYDFFVFETQENRTAQCCNF